MYLSLDSRKEESSLAGFRCTSEGRPLERHCKAVSEAVNSLAMLQHVQICAKMESCMLCCFGSAVICCSCFDHIVRWNIEHHRASATLSDGLLEQSSLCTYQQCCCRACHNMSKATKCLAPIRALRALYASNQPTTSPKYTAALPASQIHTALSLIKLESSQIMIAHMTHSNAAAELPLPQTHVCFSNGSMQTEQMPPGGYVACSSLRQHS